MLGKRALNFSEHSFYLDNMTCNSSTLDFDTKEFLYFLQGFETLITILSMHHLLRNHFLTMLHGEILICNSILVIFTHHIKSSGITSSHMHMSNGKKG